MELIANFTKKYHAEMTRVLSESTQGELDQENLDAYLVGHMSHVERELERIEGFLPRMSREGFKVEFIYNVYPDNNATQTTQDWALAEHYAYSAYYGRVVGFNRGTMGHPNQITLHMMNGDRIKVLAD